MDAHSAMNKIQLNTQSIPRHIQIARKLVTGGTSYKVLARLLPNSLQRLTRIGEECVTLASNTKDAFTKVHKLVQDVEVATAASKSGYDKELLTVQEQRNLSNIRYMQMEASRKVLEEELKEAKATVRNTRAQLSEALRKLPIGLEATFYDLMYAAGNFLGDIAKIASGMAMGNMISAVNTTHLKKNTPFALTETITAIRSFEKSLGSVINKVTKNSQLTVKEISAFDISFEFWFNIVKKISNNAIKDRAINLIQNGRNTLAQMKKTVEQGKKIKEDTKQRLNTLMDDIKQFDAPQNSATTNDLSVPQQTSSNVPSAISNARYKIEVTQKELRAVEQTYEQRRSESRKLLNDMNDLFIDMAKLHMTEIRYDTILKLLHKAVDLLIKIKTNWSKLVFFFRTISDGIELSVSRIITPFFNDAAVVTKWMTTADDRKSLLEMIDTQGKDVQELSYHIFILSRTYVDISRKYLMPKLADITKLTLITDETRRQETLKELENEQKEMEKQVKEIINSRNRLFEGKVSKQRNQLDDLDKKLEDQNQDDQQASVKDKK
jgi:hypothetical protein